MPVKKKQVEEIKMPSDFELIEELILSGLALGIIVSFGIIMVILIYLSLIGIGYGVLNTLYYFDILPPSVIISNGQIGTTHDAVGFGMLSMMLILIPIYMFFSYKDYKQDEYRLKLRRQQL